MKSPWKRILPILFSVLIIFSIVWYLFVYDKDFTKDFLLTQARFFEKNGNHSVAAWLYQQAYLQSDHNKDIAIELADQYKAAGNYTKAEYTLSQAIASNPSAELYIALCQTYVEQNKLLDAVTMLKNVTDPEIKAELDALRPATPTADQETGFHNQYITVHIDAPEGDLYAATDGEYPSTETDLYTDGFALPAGESTIYAICVGDNGLVSELAVFQYTVTGVIEEITLASPELDSYVRKLLGLSQDHRLLTSDLWNITSLTVPNAVLDYSDLKYFIKLNELVIDKGSFSDLSFLAGLNELNALTITNTPISSSDLKILSELPKLEKLTLANCGLGNIENLSAAKLTYLDLNSNAIRELSPLSFMTSLKHLDLSYNALTNLNDLSALTGLEVLNISGNSLSSIRPLATCIQLKELYLSFNTIGNLSGIESLTELTMLDLSSNTLTDVDLLAGLTKMQKLILNNNTLLNISAISAMVNLEHLEFAYNQITELPRWSGNPALVYIDGTSNQLSSLATLSLCKNLNTVMMNYNNISSVSALSTCRNLIRVDVNGNPVTNVSALEDSGVIVNWDPV